MTTQPEVSSDDVSTAIETLPKMSSVFSDEELRNIKSFDDAVSILATREIPVENYDDYGTGFKVTEKERLVGVPLFLAMWRFNKGKQGSFVSVVGITKSGEKVIFNDGSTGIRDQLLAVTRERVARKHPQPNASLLVEGGLRRSDYSVDLADPKTGEVRSTEATTYYLAN